VPSELLDWERLAPLPEAAGETASGARGGTYAGVSGGTLIVAGGMKETEGDPQTPLDTMYLLEKIDGPWKTAPERLPRAMTHGVSVTYDDTVVCAGGDDGTRGLEDVFALRFIDGRIEVTELPPLPEPCTHSCGALLGKTLYVAGGRRQPDATRALHSFWALDLSLPAANLAWKELEPWPGPARWGAVAGAQDGSFVLFGGVPGEMTDGMAGAAPAMPDAYRYTPGKGGDGTWRRIEDLPLGLASALAAGPASALPLGQAHLAVLSGLRPIHVYHTVTNTWSQRGEIPQGWAPSAAAATPLPATDPWNGGWMVLGRKTATGIPSAHLWRASLRPQEARFSALDWGMLLLYLAVLVAMGCYFARRESGTEDYLLAGRRIPWWAAGISIFGTQLSAISYVATPAVYYATDWVRFLGAVMYLPAAWIAVRFFLPFFRRLNVTTAYEYLEQRFSVDVRVFSSGVFILSQLIRVSVVVYLPALALGAVTGMNVDVCISAMGVLCILYTVLGGMEAVIWTDVLQVAVLMSGAVLCLGIVIVDAGGLGATIEIAAADNKFRAFDWRWDATEMVVWVMASGSFFGVLSTFSSDQSTVQRYLTTRDERASARGIWSYGILAVVTAPIFCGLGTALYVFYKSHPELLNPGRNDEIVPWFIVQQLPSGMAGLLIAGIFAAAMSSLDSAMHSAATAYVVDFHGRFKRDLADADTLKIARWATVLTGIFGTLMAIWLAHSDIQSTIDTFASLIGLVIGSLGGVFLLAVLTQRTNSWGALVGVVAGALSPLIVSKTTDLNVYLYPVIGVVACVVAGYLTSFVLPGDKRDLTGLTVHALPDRSA
jgi:SSS family transporter